MSSSYSPSYLRLFLFYKIHKLHACSFPHIPQPVTPPNLHFGHQSSVTVKEDSKLLSDSPETNNCDLDPIPARLLKKMIVSTLPINQYHQYVSPNKNISWSVQEWLLAAVPVKHLHAVDHWQMDPVRHCFVIAWSHKLCPRRSKTLDKINLHLLQFCVLIPLKPHNTELY